MKNKNLNVFLIAGLLGFLLFTACKEESKSFPLIETIPCEDTNTQKDPTIINDFECQNNITLPNVEQILNPDQSNLNTSNFVGKYTDPTSPWDALIIDFGVPLDLSVNNTFKIKIWSSVAGPFIAKLEGGTSPAVEKSIDVTAGGWKEYTFDFSDQFNQSHNKLVMFFNAGNETSGGDIYYIDELQFIPTADPCAGVTPDISVAINDFDCQQNIQTPEITIVATPSKSDINTSKFCGRYEDEAGPWDAVILENVDGFDLSTKNVFSIKVHAPVEGVLKAKLEGGTSAAIEKDAQISTLNSWVEYTYDFSDQADANHTKIVLFFNAGVEPAGTDIYYIDDIKFKELSDPCLGTVTDNNYLNDFDCQQNTTIPGFLDVAVVANPKVGTANASANVLMVTDNGTEPWDALIFESGTAFDLSTNNMFRIKILSDRTAPLLAKLEGGSSPAKEVWGEITMADDWVEYQFDFSDQAAENHTKMVLFFNGGQDNGTSADVYHIDDLRWADADPCFGVAKVAEVVNDFECQQNYTVPCCITATVIDNPDASGENTSAKVLEVNDNGTAPWDALVFENTTAIDLATKNQLKITIWSSKAVPLLAKLEGGSSPANEVWGAIDVADAWKTYTFDFSGQAAENHKKIVFFFNGGQEDGTAEDLYYIDDIKWE